MKVIKTDVLDFNTGKNIEEISLEKSIFGVEDNEKYHTLVKNIIYWQRNKKYKKYNKTKNISEVSGSGKKPHSQKGSGRARKASLRANHMRGGGIVHGPRAEQKNISSPNKKMKKLATRYVLSNKLQEKSLLVVKDIQLDKISTKNLRNILNNKLSISSAILCVDKFYETLFLSARNIPNIKLTQQSKIGIYDILKYKNIIFSLESIKLLQNKLL